MNSCRDLQDLWRRFFADVVDGAYAPDRHARDDHTEQQTQHPTEALVGFQGRGFDDGVQPDFWALLLIKVLIFQ